MVPASLPLSVDQAGLFSVFGSYQLSVDAACRGIGPGKAWFDVEERPTMGLLLTPAGAFLGGVPGSSQRLERLRGLIPFDAELYIANDAWKAVLDVVWENFAYFQHPRRYLEFSEFDMVNWRLDVPETMSVVSVDEAFLQRDDLDLLHEVWTRVNHNWGGIEAFLERGFGVCMLQGDRVVTRCIADSVVGERCELGVGTHPAFRRRGLAAMTVAAAIEGCLQRGQTRIGWHCLASNIGSARVAHAVGFRKIRDYFVLSSGLPAENASDLSTSEWRSWALAFDEAAVLDVRHDLTAAACWALAGSADRSFRILQEKADQGWQMDPTILHASYWPFFALHENPAWDALLSRLDSVAANRDIAP